ncbi:arylsulfatase [Shewanella woodyi]|uniref:Sulfatase n=1 Tax=Shewanella woodyi (strain ATCC 51908 / MS32) TaxID=392500 RepID=B1KPE7_SHEWM|nr:arylsulfatase [Shewanella woodyi]ACA84717.1 sulfatase [Shewanella woodyi ATCC 51908]
MQIIKKNLMTTAITTALSSCAIHAYAADKPNILVIMGDDIGYWNLSTYNQGMLGYSTPNIDRIAKEGAKFTSYYAQQSSTAGRSAFITGQMPIRTGLTKVGFPGAKQGISKQDPTMATLLKNLGYATGQFGKNHLGDLNEYLPTNHGFDEFMGNLYHLNSEEEPEHSDYPKDPNFLKHFAPRGVLKSTAKSVEKDNPQGNISPSQGDVIDTGPLTRKRMETIDNEFMSAASDFMERQVQSDTPFFIWVNPSRMHNFTHVPPQYKGKTGLNEYADGMLQHDDQVGKLLDKVEKMGIDDNTIIIYTTDNGPMLSTWPDAGMAPFRGEKNTGWEGGFRVPTLIKWPGQVQPGSVIREMFASEDWLPTLLAAAGETEIKNKLLNGYTVNELTYKVHLDGFDQRKLIMGTGPTARQNFFYWSDDGDLLAMRYGRWKLHFNIQESSGIDVWRDPFTKLRAPLLFDMETDPFERGDTGFGYDKWWYEHSFIMMPALAEIGKMKATLAAYPPRQKPASFVK